MSSARLARAGALEGAGALAARFDAAAERPQLVALVSPTCEVCLDGVAMILQGLDEPAGSGLQAHVVWTPVLAGDTMPAAEEAARVRDHERVQHYWDGARSISDAARLALDLAAWDRTVAWDVYLLFRRGARWSAPFPAPATWLHQLRIDDQPSLDADSLRIAMQLVATSESA